MIGHSFQMKERKKYFTRIRVAKHRQKKKNEAVCESINTNNFSGKIDTFNIFTI